MGELNEDYIKDYFLSNWLIKLTKTEDNHPMDFTDEYGDYYEVKSRNCNHDKYPTTMIGVNKFEFAKLTDKNVLFIFCFKDGIYGYEYTIYNNFKRGMGGRRDRGKDEIKQYVYIPIDKLFKID